jgi:hypothetical protein
VSKQLKQINMKKQLFQYCILWHPSEQMIKEGKGETKMIQEPKFILSKDEGGVKMLASREIPDTYINELEQIEILITAF